MTRGAAMKTQYEKCLLDFGQERSDLLEAAQKLALEQKAVIISEARQEAETIREHARLDVQRERELAQEVLRLQIIEVSACMAEKIIAHTVDQETLDRLYSEALEELEDTEWLI